MSVLLYAIGEADVSCQGAGLDGSPLRTRTHGTLAAVISDIDGAPPADIDHLWEFERVVERLMDAGTILPGRFGTVVADDAGIDALLTERQAELAASLEQVQGRVEYAERVPEPDPAPESIPTTGTAYMERLLARQQRL